MCTAARNLMAAVLLAASSAAWSETAYIRDTLYVPLRGGQSTEHRILHRGLRSGTELEVLEVNEESGYSRVRTPDGLEGWLQSQYLVPEPVAGDRLAAVTEQLEALEARYQQTLLRLREATELSNSLTLQNETLATEKEALAEELRAINELAANVIGIDEQNQELKAEQDDLLDRINELIEENELLADDRAQRWFLAGAGTIMIGLLFGFWIGRRLYARRNRSGWT